MLPALEEHALRGEVEVRKAALLGLEALGRHAVLLEMSHFEGSLSGLLTCCCDESREVSQALLCGKTRSPSKGDARPARACCGGTKCELRQRRKPLGYMQLVRASATYALCRCAWWPSKPWRPLRGSCLASRLSTNLWTPCAQSRRRTWGLRLSCRYNIHVWQAQRIKFMM